VSVRGVCDACAAHDDRDNVGVDVNTQSTSLRSSLGENELPDLLLMPESNDARLYRKEFWLDCTGTPMGLKEVKT